MNLSRVKNSSGDKIALQLNLHVGAFLHMVLKVNPYRKRMIGTWNIKTMLQTSKLKNIEIEIERMKLEILSLCGTR